MLPNQIGICCLASVVLLGAVEPSNAADAWMMSDVSGVEHQIPSDGKSKATVIIFMQPDCPISNQYAPTLNRMHGKFSPEGVRFFRVYPDKELTVKEVKKHGASYQFTLPALLDSKHVLVKMTGATITPEAVVFDGQGRQVYRGRINNRYIDFGKKRPRATRQDLQLVLEAVMNGQSPEAPVTQAIGCYIDQDDYK